MTKKHFELVARVLKDAKVADKATLANAFIVKFKKDNPRFDTARFLKAVGVNA